MLENKPFGTFSSPSRRLKYIEFFSNNKNVPGWLRRFFRTRVAPPVVDKELDGVRFRCYPRINVHDRFVWGERLFKEERKEFEFLFESLKDEKFFIDIGANTGTICIPVALKCPWLENIVAIEPDPETYQKLQYNVLINSISNINTMQVAIGECDKKAFLVRVNKLNVGQNSIVFGASNMSNVVQVEMLTLQQICQKLKILSIGALKIDIEGYEDRALMPFFNSAPHSLWPKAVVIEHTASGAWLDDCIGHMKSVGYTVADKSGINTMLTLSD